MKQFLLKVCLLILLPVTGFCQQGAAWQKYTSAGGHYSISFPGAPVETVQYDSSSSVVLGINIATYENGTNAVYMCSYIDMSAIYKGDRDTKELLEASRDGALASMAVTKSATTATNLTGDPYIEFTFSNDQFTGKDRIYFINKYQYSVVTIFDIKEGLGPDADKFIKSFKHSM